LPDSTLNVYVGVVVEDVLSGGQGGLAEYHEKVAVSRLGCIGHPTSSLIEVACTCSRGQRRRAIHVMSIAGLEAR